ncbi:MAG TPA: hypothetical protein VFE36_13600 [Candidatus Baltobacteraceae bacterium]|nr:hypothetical protein [Candidatus Baltobacteraceae bacterium]
MKLNLTDPLNDDERGRGLTERQLGSIRAIVYLALLVLVVVFGLIKLWQMPMASADFKFTDFVVVGLAMFSIWLSVSILDRATQQNNRFYESVSASLNEVSSGLEQLQQELRTLQSRSKPTTTGGLNEEHIAGLQR